MFNDVTSCNLCGSARDSWKPLFALNEQQTLMECRRCGLIFNDRQRADLAALYGEEYFGADEKSTEGGYYDYTALERDLNHQYGFARRFILAQAHGDSRKLSILDIGCGYGFFLGQFAGDSRFALAGVEISVRACEETRRRGIDARQVLFEEMAEHERFDFVAAFDYIEHVLDPTATMRKVHRITRDGGHVIFILPDAGSLFFRLLKRRWPAVHPATHNFYFTPRTMERLARGAGFEVVSIRRRHIIWRDARHFRKRLGVLFPFSRRLFDLFAFMDSRLVPFVSGGTIEVILRKGEMPR